MLKSRYSLSGVCVSVGLVVHPMITIILLHVSPLIRPLHGIIHNNIHTRKAIVVYTEIPHNYI